MSTSSTIGSAFFTDRNNLGYPGRPLWSEIFDYYYLDPPAGKYTLVTPSDRGQRRTIPDCITVNERSTVLSVKDTSDRDVVKVAGQGEFDNIHMAPRMIAPQEVLDEIESKHGAIDRVLAASPSVLHWQLASKDNGNSPVLEPGRGSRRMRGGPWRLRG